jgi:hypothetical protein
VDGGLRLGHTGDLANQKTVTDVVKVAKQYKADITPARQIRWDNMSGEWRENHYGLSTDYAGGATHRNGRDATKLVQLLERYYHGGHGVWKIAKALTKRNKNQGSETMAGS